MKDYGRRKDKLAAVVVVGEASESEEEEEEVDEAEYGKQAKDIDHQRDHRRRPVAIDGQEAETIGKYVDDAKQVTDSKSSLPAQLLPASRTNRHEEEDNGELQASASSSTATSSSSTLSTNKKPLSSDSASLGLNRSKDSLLHSLLRESNASLKHNLINLACTPYAMYSKDVGRITRHMIATQKHLQSGCALLQRASNDINQLNKSFTTLSALMSSNKL